MEYKGIVKTRENWMTVLFLVLAALMLWRTIATGKWIYIPMLIIVVLACFFRREHSISEKGVEIRNILFGRTIMRDLWKWGEVTSMETNYEKVAPNVRLLISKDIVIRAFVMTKDDARGAMKLARRMNPAIQMNELSEEEQERRDDEILHQQEIEEARQRAAKASARRNAKSSKKKKKK